MWGNGTDVGLQKENPTIAELLKPLGYATGQFGKNRLGDLNKYLPTVHGFDEFYGNLTISMPRRSLRIRARGSQEAGCRSRGVEFAPRQLDSNPRSPRTRRQSTRNLPRSSLSS
jgi:arylsulfatase A-like enzyme